jgi:hypothetical protein
MNPLRTLTPYVRYISISASKGNAAFSLGVEKRGVKSITHLHWKEVKNEWSYVETSSTFYKCDKQLVPKHRQW